MNASMKKKSPVVGVASYILDCEYIINSNGKLELLLPVVELPELNCPLLHDDVCEWSKSVGISENVYGSAYEAAHKAFMQAVENGTIAEELATRLTKVSVVKEYPY